MGKKLEKNQEIPEETTKKKRSPALILATIINDDGKMEEMDFEGKAAVRIFVEEECKGKFNKDGWVPLKEGGRIRFIIKPQYLYFASVTSFREVNVNDL